MGSTPCHACLLDVAGFLLQPERTCDAHVLHVTANQYSWHTGSVMLSLSARLITQDFATAVALD